MSKLFNGGLWCGLLLLLTLFTQFDRKISHVFVPCFRSLNNSRSGKQLKDVWLSPILTLYTVSKPAKKCLACTKSSPNITRDLYSCFCLHFPRSLLALSVHAWVHTRNVTTHQLDGHWPQNREKLKMADQILYCLTNQLEQTKLMCNCLWKIEKSLHPNLICFSMHSWTCSNRTTLPQFPTR